MNKLMSALQTVQTKTGEVASNVTTLAGELSDDKETTLAGELSDDKEEGEGSSNAGLSDVMADLSSLDEDDGSMNEEDTLEVQGVYDAMDSGNEDADGPEDMEAGGIRKRNVEVEECSDG